MRFPRIVIAFIAVHLALVAIALGGGVGTADAQPGGIPAPTGQVRLQQNPDGTFSPAPGGGAAVRENQPRGGQPGALRAAPRGEPGTVKKDHPHGDRVESQFDAQTKKSKSKGLALLFWLFAAAVIGGAVFVITRLNLIAAVMGMVGTFLGISAVYMMLYAHFLSVVQMLVYAGAIMVLFVFVVMILNRPEDEPVAPTGRFGQALGGLAILYLMGRLIMMLWKTTPENPAASMLEPQPLVVHGVSHDWGSVRAVGTNLFGPGLFPFEAISILLLVAVVGAIAIAGPLQQSKGDPEKTVGRDPEAKGGH